MARASLFENARPKLKFAFIQRHQPDAQAEYEIKIMCRVLSVSRSGYYVWVKRQKGPPSIREMANQEVAAAIRTTFERSRNTYRAPLTR